MCPPTSARRSAVVRGPPGRRLHEGPVRRWARILVSLAALSAAAALVLTLRHGGASASILPALTDVGLLPGWITAAGQLLRDTGMAVAAGTLLTAGVLLPSQLGILSGTGRSLVRGAGIAAAITSTALVVQAFGTIGEIAGAESVWAAGPELWGAVLIGTTPGRVLAGQLGLTVAAGVLAATARTVRGAIGALVAVLTAIAVQSVGSHAVAEAGHVLSVLTLGLHLMAAALWSGGLAGLLVLAVGQHPALGAAVARYSPLALLCAVGLAVSGLLGAVVRMTERDLLPAEGYVIVLLAKVAVFILLVGLGWAHRRFTVPPTGDGAVFPRRRFLRLAIGEVVVMAGAYGLAVGLSRTPPPPRAPVDLLVDDTVLGVALATGPTPITLFGSLHLDAFGIAIAGMAGPLYLAGVRILRRRGDAWPRRRTASFLGGLLAVLAVTCTGTGRYAMALFSVHMAQHMTLNMIAPLLLVLGAPITLALRALPPPGRRLLLSLVRSRLARLVSHPAVTTGIFVLSLYALYFTPLFSAAMGSHWGHVLMQLHFLVSGWLFFSLLIGPDPDPQRPPHLVRVPLLLAVMLSHTVFSMVLVFGGTVIGGDYYEHLGLSWTPALIEDQVLGGVLAWVSGEMVIVGVLAGLVLQWFAVAERADRAALRARDHGHGRQPGSAAHRS